MTTSPANPPPPPPGGDDGDDAVPLFTASELNAAREQAADEARRHFAAKAGKQTAQPASTADAIDQLIKLKLAEALGGMKPTSAAPPPAQPPGSAPARVVTADTPMWELPPEDLRKLEKQIGPFEFAKRLKAQLRDTGQRFKLRR